MTTTNLDADELKKVPANGWVNEDVAQQIIDTSKIELVFSSRAGSVDVSAKYSEWNADELREPDLANAKVDGQDTMTLNDAKVGSRMGNYCQISTKTVQLSTRAQAVNSVGNSGSMAYQLPRRMDELRRDLEAISMSAQASVEGDADAGTASKTAGIFAFFKTNVNFPGDGAAGGFDSATKIVTAPTQGTKRKLTETMVRDMIQECYMNNGNPDVMMARPGLIRKFSEYCFTAEARIGTLLSDVGQGQGPSTAKGAVNVFVGDFGVVLKLLPNRLQPEVGAKGSKVTNVGLFDFEFLKMGYLSKMKGEPLAKTGLASKMQLSVDWQARCTNEKANGAIYTIDETAAVTQA